jgi:hypothetical protein
MQPNRTGIGELGTYLHFLAAVHAVPGLCVGKGGSCDRLILRLLVLKEW